MKFFALSALVLCISVSISFAQSIKLWDKDSVANSDVLKKIKAGERNVFLDPEVPHFIMTSANQNFVFGIGGVVNMSVIYDFNGLVNNLDFVTANIPVPTQNSANDRRYGFGMGQSKLFFKLVGDEKYIGRIIVYVEGDFRGVGNGLRMRQAYVSAGHFLIGQTWSTFMDLDAAIATVDGEGPNTQISVRQPMFRYSWKFNDAFSGAVALEMPYPSVLDSLGTTVINYYSPMPDIPLRLKYEFPFGHVQTGGILRRLAYKDLSTSEVHDEWGWGVSLSGSFDFKSTSIVYQGVYGKGITNYIQDLSSLNYDLIANPNESGKFEAMPMYGGYAGIQQYLNKKQTIYADWVVGYARIGNSELKTALEYKSTLYSALNVFWEPMPSAAIGLEYLAGIKTLENNERGVAHRIDMLLKYSF